MKMTIIMNKLIRMLKNLIFQTIKNNKKKKIIIYINLYLKKYRFYNNQIKI